jgi:hypothetical protein
MENKRDAAVAKDRDDAAKSCASIRLNLRF